MRAMRRRAFSAGPISGVSSGMGLSSLRVGDGEREFREDAQHFGTPERSDHDRHGSVAMAEEQMPADSGDGPVVDHLFGCVDRQVFGGEGQRSAGLEVL